MNFALFVIIISQFNDTSFKVSSIFKVLSIYYYI